MEAFERYLPGTPMRHDLDEIDVAGVSVAFVKGMVRDSMPRLRDRLILRDEKIAVLRIDVDMVLSEEAGSLRPSITTWFLLLLTSIQQLCSSMRATWMSFMQ